MRQSRAESANVRRLAAPDVIEEVPVNRSCRRALAMGWTVAVGAVCAGVAVCAGPAAADVGPGGGIGRDADAGAASGNPGPRRLERESRHTRWAAGGTRQGRDVPGGIPSDVNPAPPDWECHWPPFDPVVAPGAGIGVGGGGGGGGMILAANTGAAAVVMPGPPLSGPATTRTLTGAAPIEPGSTEPDSEAPESFVPAAPLTTPLGGPMPPTPTPPGPPAQSPPPPVPPPASGAPDLQEPQPLAAPVNPTRLGYPDYLQSATLAEVAALATLGAAGLMALAGAGGVVGYRQAKTGFALRAAGTARFLS